MSGTDKGIKHALLIGINFYMPGNPPEYLHLSGCISDIKKSEKYLLHIGVPAQNITKLTSTVSQSYYRGDRSQTEPLEPKELWPTYLNIKHKIEELTKKANPGDYIFIHYSGHGTRTDPGESAYAEPGWKDELAQDEALVPTDYLAGGPLLDDVTVAYLFNEMVEKGLKLTVVLDCCNSGGAVRFFIGEEEEETDPEMGEDAKFYAAIRFCDPRRGIKSINIPAADVIPREKLFASWKKQAARGGSVNQGALVNPSGYQLFAAARAHESAWETSQTGGALTHHLTTALLENSSATQSMLHRRVDDGVQNTIIGINQINLFAIRKGLREWATQVPLFEGDGENCFFSGEKGVKGAASSGMRVGDGKVEVAAGRAHGVGEGAEFRVYNWDAVNLADEGAPRVVVTGVAALRAEAVWKEGSGPGVKKGTTGCRAVLAKMPPDVGQPLEVPGGASEEELAHLTRFKSLLELKNPGPCPSLRGQFEIKIEGQTPQNGVYEIKDNTTLNVVFTSTASIPVYLTCLNLSNNFSIAQVYPLNSDYDVIYPDETRRMSYPMTIPPGLDTSVDIFKCWLTTRPMPTLKKPVVPSPVSFRTLEMAECKLAAGTLASEWAKGWVDGVCEKGNEERGAAPDVEEGEWCTVGIVVRTTR